MRRGQEEAQAGARMRGSHRAVGPLSIARRQEDLSRKQEDPQAAARVEGSRKATQTRTTGREPRQSWSHTRWSEQKKSECDQEPRIHMASAIKTKEIAGPDGSRIC